MRTLRIVTYAAPVAALVAACHGKTPTNPPAPTGQPLATAAASSVVAPVASPPPAPVPAAPTEITVTLEARSGSKLAGTAVLTAVDGGVKVVLKVTGAPPGKVGTHVHEKDDCSAPDAKSAGGHFNPANHPHGLPDGERHLGDLGNIEVGKDGTGSHEIVVKGATLVAGEPNSFVGRSIIVHEKQDDGGQPVGNAGGRIGCGVIHLAGG
ncbi:MAG: superoxide dismutase family protein [Myxococcales bacterium]|nr:superoxide dismutase family protein [Myxococcales bacterium]